MDWLRIDKNCGGECASYCELREFGKDGLRGFAGVFDQYGVFLCSLPWQVREQVPWKTPVAV